MRRVLCLALDPLFFPGRRAGPWGDGKLQVLLAHLSWTAARTLGHQDCGLLLTLDCELSAGHCRQGLEELKSPAPLSFPPGAHWAEGGALRADFALSSPKVGSLGAQLVKNPPATQETWVQSLGWEDALEKGTATHSSILVWRIPWTEKPGSLYSPWGRKELDMTERLLL